MNNKKKMFWVRLLCFVLAGLMVASAAATILIYLFA